MICSLMHFSNLGEIPNLLDYVLDFKYKIMEVWYIFSQLFDILSFDACIYI